MEIANLFTDEWDEEDEHEGFQRCVKIGDVDPAWIGTGHLVSGVLALAIEYIVAPRLKERGSVKGSAGMVGP